MAYQRRSPEPEILPIGLECSGMSNVGFLVVFLVSAESFLRTRDKAFSKVQLLQLQITQCLSISSGQSRSLPVASSISWLIADHFTSWAKCIPLRKIIAKTCADSCLLSSVGNLLYSSVQIVE